MFRLEYALALLLKTSLIAMTMWSPSKLSSRELAEIEIDNRGLQGQLSLEAPSFLHYLLYVYFLYNRSMEVAPKLEAESEGQIVGVNMVVLTMSSSLLGTFTISSNPVSGAKQQKVAMKVKKGEGIDQLITQGLDLYGRDAFSFFNLLSNYNGLIAFNGLLKPTGQTVPG
ncbi:hypothetical protein L228DRAFT_242192 [Xylona heveae TC161]|uniref:Uncharacterized protein n=1 Tax=Xylona heveae (strain CBS 132557 / TC161) TaxID=1328760 RepID=A0A164ZBF3_XYLHT|nr:hypothetical protein L228DRAFT_242192 [Xylona heveae TC161]KZF18896.1 hypothetical protein L228DRAFT_242192 [Xylona heveae TC161]